MKHDSVSRVISSGQPKDSLKHKFYTIHQNVLPDYTDTTSVCIRNSIADVTFYDFNNFILRIGFGSYRQFPYIFTEKVRQRQMEEKTLLIKHLNQGNDLPSYPLHADWIILIILVTASIFALVRKASDTSSTGFARFFMFRGINDPVSRNSSGLFHWQSTILNLISFIIIGLFGYSAISYYNLIPTGFKGITIWLLALGIISLAVTLRHITCIITGVTSGKQEVFMKYLLGIYQSYRVGASFLFVIIILMSYTRLLPARDFIISGIIVVGLMYFIRVVRLLIIFLNKNISIFYLILYLCALEILPVLIIVKYFTGLV
ncbi:MAG: DUF4271 domain-containing protein [Bacteroidales bacterium]